MDVGTGRVVPTSSSGLSVDVGVRLLLVHQAVGIRERGMSLSLSYNPTPFHAAGNMAARRRGAGCRRALLKRCGGASTMVGMSHTGTSRWVRPQCGRRHGLPVGGRPVGTRRVCLRPSELQPGLPCWLQPWGAGDGLAPAGRGERRCLARGHLRMQDKPEATCSLGPQRDNPEDPGPISKRTVRAIPTASEPPRATTRQTCPVEPHPGCAAKVATTYDLPNRAALVGTVRELGMRGDARRPNPRSQADTALLRPLFRRRGFSDRDRLSCHRIRKC